MILAPELESLRTDRLVEEGPSSDNDDEGRADVPEFGSVAGDGSRWSPTSVAVVRMVSADKSPLSSSPVHGQPGHSDAAERRKIGVAARFVISAAGASTPGDLSLIHI